MSSVSSLGTSGYSSIQPVQTEIAKENSAETLNSGRQSAGSTASGKAETSSTQVNAEVGGSPILPDDLRTKIDALIKSEVSNGRLTIDQAAKLQSVFSIAFAAGSAGDEGSQEEARTTSATGLLDVLSSADSGSPPASNSQTSASTASGTPSDEVGVVLNDFLKLLQNAKSTALGYGALGNSSASTTSMSVQLINYSA